MRLNLTGKKRLQNKLAILSQPHPESYFNTNRSNYALTGVYRENVDYRYISFGFKQARWDYIESINSGKSILFKRENLIDDVTFDPFSSLVGIYEDYFIFSGNPGRIAEAMKNVKVTDKSLTHLIELEHLMRNKDPEDNSILFLLKFDF